MADGDVEEAKRKLAAAGAAGYAKYPNDCSHSIWWMLHLLGVDQDYLDANGLMARIAAPGSGWRQVTLEEAGQLANQGRIVLDGLRKPRGHGHVQLLIPGPLRPSGGFRMANGQIMPAERGRVFPLAASGAASSWAGAHSAGEKTVRDPWTDEDWRDVTFWVRQ